MRLVITGGGFLGRHVLRRFAKEGWVQKITVVSRSENSLAACKDIYPAVRCVLGDIADPAVAQKALADCTCVVHTAAMKHIDLCEENILEAVRTNWHGTRTLLDAFHGDQFVFVSTDKACSPSGVYGATKLLGERLVLSEAQRRGFRGQVIRSGNIMASSGSVIPRWARSIQERNEIAVTDPDMTRMFIAGDELADFIWTATKECQSGVFVPPLVEVRIGDLADAVVAKWGSKNTTVKVCGLRPAEKMREIITLDGSVGHVPGYEFRVVPLSGAEVRTWVEGL